MEPAHTHSVVERYASFARNETPHHSAVMHAWAAGVSEDPETCALIETLPPRERQPNLVFSAARVVAPDLVNPHQAEPRPDEYERLRTVLHEHWAAITKVTATRHTQTNEAGRMGVLMPAFAKIQKEAGRRLALIELGASAGLCLHPNSWTYRYTDRESTTLAELNPSAPAGTLAVVSKGDTELPSELPQIEWRVGVDLNPLNPANPQDAAWLRALIWPGQSHRLERLDAAIADATRDPVLVLPRDITSQTLLDEVLAVVPPEYLPVVFHSATLAYLEAADRVAVSRRLAEAVQQQRIHWVSNEGSAGVPSIHAEITNSGFDQNLRRGAFVVSIDGKPHYQADGHAGWIL